MKFRKGGEPHETNADVVDAAHALRLAVRQERQDRYDQFAALVNGRSPMELRDLLEPAAAEKPVPLDEVEPAESIVRRFSAGGMSHGALSAEAHQTIATAFNRLRARSNCGEGGEDPARFRTERNSRIKQVASGRFGVTPEYAAFADELQIKIAQGSKPGEGGQLPGHKVSVEIARLRHTTPGVALISPPPHHDIYSIEDLAQLIFDLRQVNPEAAISVKLVAESGVGLVAAGCVKALADVVHVAGCDGGTGASPLSSIKNAGLPWELGLAETQQALVANGLRRRARLRVDGGVKTGRDVVVAALLGADELSFGTALLLAEGCLMVRSCHLDTCPVGIATQRPELRAKFAATPEQIEAYLLYVAEEARAVLASLGLSSFEEAVGRTDLLRRRSTGEARADALDLSPLLAGAGGRYEGEPMPVAGGGELGARLAEDARPALEGAALVEPAYAITTWDRAVGARLGGLIGRDFGAQPPPGRVRARFDGSAGQSFGAFLAAGVELDLRGEANDYVGKAMGGGRIAIRAPDGDAGDPVLIGNTALYGATGGELYCAGRAGERFAVRNSGAVAVVEGVGDHGCEYMTSGVVVVLGSTGRNFAAGMSGGEAFVYDPAAELPQRLNDDLVSLSRVTDDGELRRLVTRHERYTGSELAAALLASGPRQPASSGTCGRRRTSHRSRTSTRARPGRRREPPRRSSRPADPPPSDDLRRSRSADADALQRRVGRRQLRVELRQRVDEQLGHGQVPDPVVVGRNDVPGRPGGRGLGDRLLVGGQVVVPAGPIVEIARTELPRLLRILEPLLQPLPLLVPGDVQEHLDDAGALVGEQALELPDVLRPVLPDLLRREPPHPHGDDVLVVGSVEDPDLSAGRAGRMDPPEVVVGELRRRRLLEGDDPPALRVHPGQDVTDRPVLSRRVEALQDEQHRAARFRPEAAVEQVQPLDQLLQPGEPPLLVRQPQPIARVAVGQMRQSFRAPPAAIGSALPPPRDSLLGGGAAGLVA